jgi:uracil-DNA glycosylase
MADEQPDSLRRQLLSHIVRLHAAGVEWLPDAPALTVARTARASTPAVSDHDVPPTLEAVDSSLSGELSLEQRQAALQLLADEVKKCTRCPELCATRTQTVFGDGAPGVELCFVGEAPGADEDAQGIPFVGAAGQMLNRIITGCGWKRQDVYICNILRCRPPGNRTPLPNEAANCRPYLERTIELVQPKYICALGACAATNLLQSTLSVGKLRGRFHSYRGIPVLVTYHPSYLLRTPEAKRYVWDDMKLLLTRMGRPIPARSSAGKSETEA